MSNDKRIIEKEMVEYLDNKLLLNGNAQDAIKNKDSRRLMVCAAEALVGVQESGGNNRGPIVQLMQDTVGGPDAWAWCFPGNVEILTEDGWEKFSNLHKGGNQRVVQVSEKGEMSVARPLAYISKRYKGPGFRLKTKSIDLTCDAGHRFWGHFNNHLKARFGTLSEVTTILSIPASRAQNKNHAHYSNHELDFLAAFLSDGFYKRRGEKTRCISIQVSRPKKIKLLKALGPFSFYKAKKVYGKSKSPLTTLNFRVPNFYSEIFSDYKKLKWSFIYSLSQAQAKRFLETYSAFDGSRKSKKARILFSSNKLLKDQLITLCLMAGYTPNVNFRLSKLSNKPCYSIRWGDAKTRTIRKSNISKLSLNSKLYCVSVPHQRIIVRDKSGTPLVVGNCMSFVQTCIAYAEIKTGIKSPIYPNEHCLTVWQLSKKQRVKTFPLPGAIVIWQKGKTQAGHTGILLSHDLNEMNTVEGNTSGEGTGVVRDGDGVFYRKRKFKGSGNMKVVGFLKPF